MKHALDAWIALAIIVAGCGERPAGHPAPARSCRCQPGESCWPGREQWNQLASRLTGDLEHPESPVQACRIDAASAACAAALDGMKNPFHIQDQIGGTQSTGWLDAWIAAPSTYAVAAESAGDVVEAVKFAREHDLRLVIKGTGHDYKGRSSAPRSLLIWTHRMRSVAIDDAFVPAGCPSGRAVPAVTIGAGARWLEVYKEVTPRHGRYVQGGGCVSVGAAGGFTQGGGYGSWSKKFGTGAAGMLEAEVVTAGGQVLIANACQNQDLFWALRGGGGGTFGVVTRMTLMTHQLPAGFGLVMGSVKATTDSAFVELLESFASFYREALNNEHWGEQATIRGDRSLQLSLVFQGLTREQAQEVWRPFETWVKGRPRELAIEIQVMAIPARAMWNHAALERGAPGLIQRDPRSGQPEGQFWWSTNQEEVSTYWYAYQSRYIPLGLFEKENAGRLARVLFEASRHWPVALHFNKGLAGASPDAIERGGQTSVNPAATRAAALAIVAASQEQAHPGVKGHEPDPGRGREERERVSAAMKVLRDATPGAGTYGNEADYFEPRWQTEFWGENYARLLAIKRKVDPGGLFYCHHCVGSEAWSSDGMCRLGR